MNGHLPPVSGMITVLENALFYAATSDESQTPSVNSFFFSYRHTEQKKENSWVAFGSSSTKKAKKRDSWS